MNGIHDMGGMHGFGPVPREEDEPVFHAPWEGRIFGIMLAVGPHRLFPRHGGLRAGLENLAPARYLASSYYERWVLALEGAVVEKGVVTAEELDARTEFLHQKPEASLVRREDPEQVGRTLEWLGTRRPLHKDVGVVAGFAVGGAVRARNANPLGHTRLPRYVRGKRGVIERIHGVHAFQDTVPQGVEPLPQAVYSVRFDAGELWGESAEARETLHVDMWESYLEPA